MIPGIVTTPQTMKRAVAWAFSVLRWGARYPQFAFLKPMTFVRLVPPSLN